MAKVLGMNCPHCGKRAQVRTSNEQSRTMRDVYFQCTNLLCGHTWVAVLEAVRTISPPSPLCHNPEINLPLAERAELERLHDRVQFEITNQRSFFDDDYINDTSDSD